MPNINLMGAGAAQQIGEQAKALGGSKALIVTDAFLHKTGMSDQIAGYLKESGIQVAIYPGAEPNPTDKNVHSGLEVFKKENCNMLVSLGGGSSHDCAKGIGIVAGNGGHIRDYEGLNKSTKPMVPLIAVNTRLGLVVK